MNSHVLVVRHGLTQWNADGRWQGWTDVTLSAIGEDQAERAGAGLAGLGLTFTRVLASDLLRARRTAERMAAAIRFDPGAIVLDPALRERNIGAWSGRTTEQINAEWGGQLDAWRRGELVSPPEGETEAAFLARSVGAIERIVRTGATTLVVTHGGVIRTIERHYGAPHRSVPNVGGRWFGRSVDGLVVPGDVVHLIPDGLVAGTTSL